MDLADAAALLDRMRSATVLVVGDLMLDRYVEGTVERISPEAPVPVVRVSRERVGLGGAGNVAANVSSLGAKCMVVGVVGDDEDGELVTEALRARGISSSGVLRCAGRPTTAKTRILAGHQQVARFDREVDEEVDDGVAERIVGAVEDAVTESDVLVVQDYDKGVLRDPVVRALRELAAARAIPLIVDPKRRHFFSYAGAMVFKPNARELAEAIGGARAGGRGVDGGHAHASRMPKSPRHPR